jgi:hypothetical protein
MAAGGGPAAPAPWALPHRTSAAPHARLPLLANHLIGPSYVSLDDALVLHGWIPEITSVTPRPSRTLSNSYGRFSYSHLPLRVYALGQQLGDGPDGLCYLIASPTKALVDRLVLSRNLAPLSRAAMGQWLLEELRLDEGLLSELSQGPLEVCPISPGGLPAAEVC